jgi:hypothetical protein
MSILESKSSENHAAGLILINQNHYSSSVHCSYYSCIQLMKHILLLNEEKTEQELFKKQQSASQNLHEFLINYFVRQLRVNNLYAQYRNTIGKLTELKVLRNDSDYREVVIDETKAKFASDLSLKILRDLKYINGIR